MFCLEVLSCLKEGTRKVSTVNLKRSSVFKKIDHVYDLGVKSCEVFLCFLAIIFLGSIVLTSQWLLCIHCFTSLVSLTGFYTEDERRAPLNANTELGSRLKRFTKLKTSS